MSQSEDRYMAERWLATAEEDLRAAETLAAAGFYAHACFAAQQCGEKAIKALWYLIDEDPWGHSIQKLVMQFPALDYVAGSTALAEKAAGLDKFYIPTRYPNGLPDLTPSQSYFQQDAEKGIALASDLLTASRQWFEGFPPAGWPDSR
jgi:HEPN domain-containing protein